MSVTARYKITSCYFAPNGGRTGKLDSMKRVRIYLTNMHTRADTPIPHTHTETQTHTDPPPPPAPLFSLTCIPQKREKKRER